MKKVFILSLLPLISLCACETAKESHPEYESYMVNEVKKTFNNEHQLLNSKYIQSVQAFAADFTNHIQENGKNKVYSPLSIATCLSMLSEGALRTAKEELNNVLHYSGDFNAKEEIQKMLLNVAVDDKKTGTYFDIGQSLWLDDGFGPYVKQEFVDTLSKYYFAELFTEDLGNPDTAIPFVNYINEKTKNFLNLKQEDFRDIFSNPLNVATMLNTIYLKSKWKISFDKKKNFDSIFNKADGSTQTVTYMTRKHEEDKRDYYYKGTDFAIASLDYCNGFKMHILLPNRNTNYFDVLNNSDNIKALLNWNSLSKKLEFIDYTIPQWDVQDKIDLLDKMQSMGLSNAFSYTADNYDGIMEGFGLYVSSATHEARVKVDNEGVEAAAYTQITVTGKGIGGPTSIDFRVDRPFMYSITDQDGLPLFMGTMFSI